MSTFMANKANIERKWYILDAAGKPLGKTAVRAADLLRGKTKPTFTPNADCGDYVIIINAGKAVLTGKKGTQKMYRTHSGWIGGLKETSYGRLMQENPERAMMLAVKGIRENEVRLLPMGDRFADYLIRKGYLEHHEQRSSRISDQNTL